MLFKRKRESSLPLYRRTNVLPIEFLFIYKVLRAFFKRSGSNRTTELFEHGYQTRSAAANHLRRPRIRKQCFQRYFVFLGPKIFNHLPKNIKETRKLSIFCRLLKDWLLKLDDPYLLHNILI